METTPNPNLRQDAHRSRPNKFTWFCLIGGGIAYLIYVSLHPMMMQ